MKLTAEEEHALMIQMIHRLSDEEANCFIEYLESLPDAAPGSEKIEIKISRGDRAEVSPVQISGKSREAPGLGDHESEHPGTGGGRLVPLDW